MIEIGSWMENFVQALERTFGKRIWFVGLQGSYARREATENSDIDVVVILDTLNAGDLQLYNAMLAELPHREKICGFVAGREEVLHWEPADLVQFYHDTIPLRGSLDAILPLLDEEAVERAVRIGLCNLYHGCVHNMLHENSEEILRGLYKHATFTVQAIVYRQRGQFICSPMALWHSALPQERQILSIAWRLKNGESVDFQAMSEILFAWCGERLRADRTEKVHEMSLRPEPFAAIAEGRKVYELRLWDEKRKQIVPGDVLIFSNTEHLSNKLYCRVKALHLFDDFTQLYRALPLEKCGYLPQEVASAKPSDMEAYYPQEKQAQYGVVAIELENEREIV